jgi:hypothetical protein
MRKARTAGGDTCSLKGEAQLYTRRTLATSKLALARIPFTKAEEAALRRGDGFIQSCTTRVSAIRGCPIYYDKVSL